MLSDKSMRIYEFMTQSEGLIVDVVADPHSSKIYIYSLPLHQGETAHHI